MLMRRKPNPDLVVKAAPTVDADADPALYNHALRDVIGNLTFTSDTVTAWFIRAPVAWSFRSNTECEAVIAATLRALLPLAGRTIHERTSFMPHPIAAWARDLDRNTPHPVNPPAWKAYLRGTQEEQRGRTMGEPVTFLGVDVGGRSTLDGIRDRFGKADDRPRERARLHDDLADITGHLSRFARPATQREVEWLLHRSHGVGLPVSVAPSAADVPLTVWDLASVWDTVDVPAQPWFAPHVRVVGAAGRSWNPAPVERYVTVLSVGRMGPQTIPETHTPWLAKALQEPGVELSVRYRIVPGAEAAKAIVSKTDLILDQVPQYAARGIPAPPNLDRTYGAARKVRDEMEEGHPEDATRFDGWVRLAVSGPTPEAVALSVQDLRKRMGGQRIDVERPRAQAGLLREFTPGEALATTAHRRRMPLVTYAAAVQHVSATLGDREGPSWGYTVGVSRSPFMWGLHRGMEVLDQSGLTPVVGGLGSGKSSVVGGMAAISTLQGVECTLLDPSGRLGAITRWAPIRDHSAILDVVRASISPFGCVPIPQRVHFKDDPQVQAGATHQDREALTDVLWREAVVQAEFERRALALDTVRASLEPELRKHPRTLSLLSEAVRRTGGKFDASLQTVLDDLWSKGNDDHAVTLHAALRDVADHPRGRFMTARDTDDINTVNKTLLVVHLGGVVFPRMDVDESSWSTDERLSLPLLNLAAHLTSARIYKGDRAKRKLVGIDEAHLFMGWGSGRSLMARLERDSRKWDARVFVASQDTGTTLSAQTASKALISDVICGATSDPEEQAAACELLGVSKDFGPALATLRPQSDETLPEDEKWRDMMIRCNGKVGRVRVDFTSTPELKALLNTSPAKDRSAPSAPAYGEW